MAMRRIELEHIVKTNHSKQAVKAEDKEKEELKATIQRMSNEIAEIKSAQSLPRENTFNTNFQRGSYKGNSKKKFHNKKRFVKSDQNRQPQANESDDEDLMMTRLDHSRKDLNRDQPLPRGWS